MRSADIPRLQWAACLHEVARSGAESGKVLVLTQVSGIPRRVIEVCGLTELLADGR